MDEIKSGSVFSKPLQYLKSVDWIVRLLRAMRYQIKKGRLRRIAHFLSSGHIIRKVRIRRFLASKEIRKLQIGGGYHLKSTEGWINGDLIAGELHVNACKRLPFPANTLDVIFTEQFIEHLPQRAAMDFLFEAFRVLKPGGFIRQGTPELEKLISTYLDRNPLVASSEVVERHILNHRAGDLGAMANSCQFINDQFRLWGHQFIYDRQTLQSITERAGFIKFQWVAFGASEYEFLRGLERHADRIWMKNGLSMFCEAQKPVEKS